MPDEDLNLNPVSVLLLYAAKQHLRITAQHTSRLGALLSVVLIVDR